MELNKLPIFKAIFNHNRKAPNNFHVPGHKQGRNVPNVLTENILKMDLTEISGLDDLHAPNGAIKEAQNLAATVFKSDRTFFLVNGSTCGIHAAILSVCNPKDRLIVQRNSHKSVIGGLILSGAEPIYINPKINEDFSIPSFIDIEDLEALLGNNLDCKGVIISNPNYYGLVHNLKEITNLVHSYNKILIVDEAHGTHFVFNDKLPVTAMEVGADISIQSAHKTLPALTQSSYLHVKGDRVDIEKLEFYLNIIQTSSPSYLFLSFLDYARYYMDSQGKEKLASLIGNLDMLRSVLSAYEHLEVLDGTVYDKTRVVVNFDKLNITGFEAADFLEEKFNIYSEMADFKNVVFVTTVADELKHIEYLLKSLKSMPVDKIHKQKDNINNLLIKLFKSITQKSIVPLSEIKLKPAKLTSLNDSIGKINFNIITPYPPGVPILNPGEIISKDVIDYIKILIKYKRPVYGVINNDSIYVI